MSDSKLYYVVSFDKQKRYYHAFSARPLEDAQEEMKYVISKFPEDKEYMLIVEQKGFDECAESLGYSNLHMKHFKSIGIADPL